MALPAMKKIFHTVWHSYMNLTLWKKMVSGYVIVVLIPTLIFSVIYIKQETKNIGDRYCADEQRLLEQSYANLKEQTSQVSVVYQLFQNSQPLSGYLTGRYSSKGDEIYGYLNGIRPLFSYIHTSIRDIKEITVFSYRKPLVPLSSDIIYLDTGNMASNTTLPTYKGSWKLEGDSKTPLFTFEKALFNSSFSKSIGALSITIEACNMLDIFSASDNKTVLFSYQNKWLIIRSHSVQLYTGQLVESTPIITDYLNNRHKDLFINTLDINELNGKIVSITPKSQVLKTGNLFGILLPLMLSLVFLTFIYYMIISSVIRRIIKFTGHLQKIDYNYLHVYSTEGYADEVGFLIKSYNNMILRISELVNSLNIVTLKKKEADFHALQAQIKPHFIYNSLETVRMMAEANGTPDVADILYNLGRFLRYNISSNKDVTQLKNEIENVWNYLEIYKASMGKRLEYSIEVDCSIDDLSCPGFILQPLVENCIHHGISGVNSTLVVKVRVREADGNILISVTDNGPGIPPERRLKINNVLMGIETDNGLNTLKSSIGITNVNERIKAFFGEHSGLFIENGEPRGTVCTIIISNIRGD